MDQYRSSYMHKSEKCLRRISPKAHDEMYTSAWASVKANLTSFFFLNWKGGKQTKIFNEIVDLKHIKTHYQGNGLVTKKQGSGLLDHQVCPISFVGSFKIQYV
jgi:hypothetical protein